MSKKRLELLEDLAEAVALNLGGTTVGNVVVMKQDSFLAIYNAAFELESTPKKKTFIQQWITERDKNDNSTD